MGDIELDDIKVVSVTGKGYKDKPRTYGKKSKCVRLSLRARTIIIYICIAAVFLIGAIILVTQMRKNLQNLDIEALNNSISRFVMIMYDDALRLQPFSRHAAWQRVTAEAVMEAMAFNNTNATPSGPAISEFINRFLNVSTAYHEDGSTDHIYRCDYMVNYWALIHPKTFKTLWFEYHPGNDNEYCTLAPVRGPPFFRGGPPIAPSFPEGFISGIVGSTNTTMNGWLSIFSPMYYSDPMSVSIEAIMIPDEDGIIRNTTVYGYLLASKTLKHHLSTFASKVPACVSVNFTAYDFQFYDDFDVKMWSSSERATFTARRTFGGKPAFAVRDAADLDKCKVRYCPAIPLFRDTPQRMAGYFTFCGQDPKLPRKTCIGYRMDRPLSRVEQGTEPVTVLSFVIVGLMVLLFVLFILFLDFAVLRRVVKLSNTIRSQTLNHQRDDFKDGDDGGNEDNKANAKGKKKGKKGKSSNQPSKSSGEDSGTLSTGDEIKNLRHAVEQNTSRLRRRVEAINDVVKMERQKILHHKQAMQLLSLWCDRTEFFPGLRPNSSLLRYEPTRNLDTLLLNPLSVEYLKSHCASDCTLENLFFLLDVSWLSEIELAEDEEEESSKRKQIHRVASDTAAAIVKRYIAEDAAQQINISAATFKVLRDMGTTYKRGMFNVAVSEVKLMLNTDILPRFQSSAAYSAMSENLYIDSVAGDDDSDWSSDSVSTAGSVLSDEANASGAANMVSFNFRNLYASFDGDTDLGSTFTNELSVIDDGEGSSKTGSLVKPDSDTRASGTNAPTSVSSSSKGDASVKKENSKQSSEKKDDDDDDDNTGSESGSGTNSSSSSD